MELSVSAEEETLSETVVIALDALLVMFVTVAEEGIAFEAKFWTVETRREAGLDESDVLVEGKASITEENESMSFGLTFEDGAEELLLLLLLLCGVVIVKVWLVVVRSETRK